MKLRIDFGEYTYDRNRTGLHHKPIYRQVLQSYGDVGQILQRMDKDQVTHLLPIPSCTDGWWTCGNILEFLAKYDKWHIIVEYSFSFRHIFSHSVPIIWQSDWQSTPLHSLNKKWLWKQTEYYFAIGRNQMPMHYMYLETSKLPWTTKTN